ncbi:hypothetical protein OKW21_005340 [Catalinimonas alkaloidigena]|uniref:hypothetical protein n=1 Tax=Catalinimonas alkaloidigena TaxID=1075417 RepID=UPI002406942C|nr:hypothetical protein [Catalinimonas alkaloidigena]MDF9800077.1 hypothetical protein [Catalinimonas alkaloidigena]
MKYTHKLFVFAAILGLLLNSACGEDTPDPTADPVPGEEISGTWVVAEPGDVSGPAADQFSDFSINITATSSQVSYTTNGNGDALVFPDQGTFAVEESDDFENGATVVRGPDNVDTRIILTEEGNVLTMDFTIDININAVNGRVASINGDYTFVLQKQQ